MFVQSPDYCRNGLITYGTYQPSVWGCGVDGNTVGRCFLHIIRVSRGCTRNPARGRGWGSFRRGNGPRISSRSRSDDDVLVQFERGRGWSSDGRSDLRRRSTGVETQYRHRLRTGGYTLTDSSRTDFPIDESIVQSAVNDPDTGDATIWFNTGMIEGQYVNRFVSVDADNETRSESFSGAAGPAPGNRGSNGRKCAGETHDSPTRDFTTSPTRTAFATPATVPGRSSRSGDSHRFIQRRQRTRLRRTPTRRGGRCVCPMPSSNRAHTGR